MGAMDRGPKLDEARNKLNEILTENDGEFEARRLLQYAKCEANDDARRSTFPQLEKRCGLQDPQPRAPNGAIGGLEVPSVHRRRRHP